MRVGTGDHAGCRRTYSTAKLPLNRSTELWFQAWKYLRKTARNAQSLSLFSLLQPRAHRFSLAGVMRSFLVSRWVEEVWAAKTGLAILAYAIDGSIGPRRIQYQRKGRLQYSEHPVTASIAANRKTTPDADSFPNWALLPGSAQK